ncbi:MAG: TPM domain-containing protein [Nanoarchaeota archaeon]|nr:TPM domain-containing protein [Nanoarchaeota archaeon]
MKLNKLFLFGIVMLLILQFATAKVSVNGFVNDHANIIDAEDEAELNSILKSLYDADIAEFAVVTIDSLEGVAIESYALDLAQGVLGDKEKNNGLLLLVSLQDREYRFEVGRGLEGDLNDGKVGRIGRTYLIPNFRAGDYGTGIVEASKSVRSVLAKDLESAYYVEEPEENDMIVWFYIIVWIIIIVLPILAAVLKNKKFKNKYFNAAAGAIILFGNRGGRGGSGGFGGFGGGGFGGGGAGGKF